MYSLNLNQDDRILSATLEKFSPNGVLVDTLPPGDITEYLYQNGQYIHQPLPKEEQPPQPTQLEQIEAQAFYTAMMTDTLIGEASNV